MNLPTEIEGASPPTLMVEPDSAVPCQQDPLERVGVFAQHLHAGRDVDAAELERHIKDCGDLLQRAMDLGNRLEAEGWMQAMYAAIAERNRRFGAERHAAFEREIDNGAGYFAACGERDRAELLRRAHG